MKFSHVFISRPRQEAEELAAMLAPLGLRAVVQPAFDYVAVDAGREDPGALQSLQEARASDLVVFTSPRAVEHGLPQLTREALLRCRVAAIGPATASALGARGVNVGLKARDGYTSEDLLDELAREPAVRADQPATAWVLAAPGGREALAEGLARLGWRTRTLMVYRPEPSQLDRSALAALEDADAILSVWTSGNAMNALAQRLPPATWFRICSGEWLVISERLKRLARAYGPAHIHLARGPGNGAILAAIRGLL